MHWLNVHSEEKKIGFKLCLLSNLFASVFGGYCTEPPVGALTFCDFVYVVADQIPQSYWTYLDEKAQATTDNWNAASGCSKSTSGKAWCKNYACALSFPRCNDAGDAPLGVCRETCVNCYDSCNPDPPLLAPDLYYSGSSPIWGDNVQGQGYDAVLPTYKCHADTTLINGIKLGLFFYGSPCTGGAISRTPNWVFIATAVVMAMLIPTDV